MPLMRFPLLSGAYESGSLVAAAQRCVNLYPEPFPQETQEPERVSHFPTPGLARRVQLTSTQPFDTGQIRGLYTTTTGVLFAVCGRSVFKITSTWSATYVGAIFTSSGPVRMVDNGANLILVDGSLTGWTVNLKTLLLSPINSVNNSSSLGFLFQGAHTVDFLDTFILMDMLGTSQFQSTTSNTLELDPTYYAGKSGSPDYLQGLFVLKRFIWLVGTLSTEIWYNAGGTQFPFALMTGPYVEYGTIAPYSIWKCGDVALWLGQNRVGEAVVLMTSNFTASPVSTFAISQKLQSYPTLGDAVGWGYQIGGHSFYVLTFPTADATWVFDISTHQWHEWVSLDSEGKEHRHRGACGAMAFGVPICGDRENGWIYELTPKQSTENGLPIKRLRSWPHTVQRMNRIHYQAFVADISVGQADSPGPLEPTPALTARTAILRCSRTRGVSWESAMTQGIGNVGQFFTTPQWRRLGLARDMVFELSWTADVPTNLNGAFVEIVPSST